MLGASTIIDMKEFLVDAPIMDFSWFLVLLYYIIARTIFLKSLLKNGFSFKSVWFPIIVSFISRVILSQIIGAFNKLVFIIPSYTFLNILAMVVFFIIDNLFFVMTTYLLFSRKVEAEDKKKHLLKIIKGSLIIDSPVIILTVVPIILSYL